MGGNGTAYRGDGVGGVMGNILVPEYTIMGLPAVQTRIIATMRHTCNSYIYFMSKQSLFNIISSIMKANHKRKH
jgi:hypothetical protein